MHRDLYYEEYRYGNNMQTYEILFWKDKKCAGENHEPLLAK